MKFGEIVYATSFRSVHEGGWESYSARKPKKLCFIFIGARDPKELTEDELNKIAKYLGESKIKTEDE